MNCNPEALLFSPSVPTGLSPTQYPMCTPPVRTPGTGAHHLDPFPTHSAK